MRSEVHTVVKMSMLVFWVAKPYGLAGRYQSFGGIYFRPEEGSSMFLRNVDMYLQVYPALLLKRPTSTCIRSLRQETSRLS
jgi:hypothetical protein